MDAEPTTEVHTAPRSNVVQDQGSFRTRFNFPGRAVPNHDDRGYGPLSTVVESFMDPDTLISMHPHRNEEVVSWVPAGLMRHDDRERNDLVTDAESVLAMNAGSGFWYAEYTAPDDPTVANATDLRPPTQPRARSGDPTRAASRSGSRRVAAGVRAGRLRRARYRSKRGRSLPAPHASPASSSPRATTPSRSGRDL